MIATNVPNLPISLATDSNFVYKGVGGFSYYINLIIYPWIVFSPTESTNRTPVPSKTFVPDNKNGC